MVTSQYPNINDNQFAGLLQVATAAAADAQERRASALGKRKRDDEALIDHQLRTPASDIHHQDDTVTTPMLQSSAAVLFREPSEKSKKYSRPPLGKVYTDLELAPEMFLQLQSAAKDFMLDPDHPERKGVVGQKKQNSSTNDVAKLKLWNCVEQFLHSPQEKTGEINCEYYFGHNAGAGLPNQPVRTFFWPDDRDQVIKMCMPLFRKMVTNERQRVYASETRKQDSRKPESSEDQNILAASSLDPSTPLNGHYQPQQQQQHLPRSRPLRSDKTNNTEQSNMFLSQSSHQQPPQSTPVTLQVNIIAKQNNNTTDSGRDAKPQSTTKTTPNERLAPKITIPSTAAQTLRSLLLEIQRRYDLTQHFQHSESLSSPNNQQQQQPLEFDNGIDSSNKPTIKVWLEQGLVTVRNENTWLSALSTAENVEWMDNELRVLVEV